MPIATGTAIALAAGIGAAGSTAAGAIGANAAGNAADAQANAADQAANLQFNLGEQNLQFQQDVFNRQQANLAPWLGVGNAGVANLASLMGLPLNGIPASPVAGQSPAVPLSGLNGRTGINSLTRGPAGERMAPQFLPQNQPLSRLGNPSLSASRTATPGGTSLASLVNPSLGAPGSLLQPFNQQFQAPTNVTEQNDPGYQFRLKQGEQALQNSAMARGGLLTGGTLTDMNNYAQDYASNEYQNVYNRALGEFQQKYNIFENNQANIFNRLAAMSGIGQTAAGQLNSAAANTGGNVSNILLGMGSQIGSNLNNAGAARASGFVGGANALGGTFQNLGNIGNLLPLMSLLQAQQQPGAVPAS